MKCLEMAATAANRVCILWSPTFRLADADQASASDRRSHSSKPMRPRRALLGRTDDGVGDAGGYDQFLLGDLGAEISVVRPVGCDDG